MANKVLLMILDGWGNGRHERADVISTNKRLQLWQRRFC